MHECSARERLLSLALSNDLGLSLRLGLDPGLWLCFGFFVAYHDRARGLVYGHRHDDDNPGRGHDHGLCFFFYHDLCLEILSDDGHATAVDAIDRRSGLVPGRARGLYHHGGSLWRSDHHLDDDHRRSGCLYGGVSGYQSEPWLTGLTEILVSITVCAT